MTTSSIRFTNGNQNWNNWTSTDGNTSTSIRFVSSSATSGQCNESKRHDNEEKALFHGIKSAYRMSGEYDGSEYGSEHPQYDAAARSAGYVAIAYLNANDVTYDRDASLEYLKDNVFGDPSTLQKLRTALGRNDSDVGETAYVTDLEAGISKAWHQIDTKEHHDDGARTALAIAEAYLGERLL